MATKGYTEIPIEEWHDLRDRLARLEEKVDNELTHLSSDMRWIKGKMSQNRPPWSVVSIIVFLSALCVGLLTKLFN